MCMCEICVFDFYYSKKYLRNLQNLDLNSNSNPNSNNSDITIQDPNNSDYSNNPNSAILSFRIGIDFGYPNT